ncbi:hypothetical protein P3S67_006078 [Capsicum chacoense]
MRIWSETTNPSIEPPKPRKIPGRPGKNRRKSKDEQKKWGKLSKKGVKITCSRCKQIGHNKTTCAKMNGMGSSNSSQPSTQPAASWNPPPPQSSSICGDTSAMTRDTYTQSQTTRSRSTFHTYATTQPSQSGSICADTAIVPRSPQRKISSEVKVLLVEGVAGRDKCGYGRGQCGAEREGGSGRGQGGIGKKNSQCKRDPI